MQYRSPYYNQTHADFRAEVREFVDEHIQPYVDEWDKTKEIPQSIYKMMGDRGYLAGILGSVDYPAQYVKNTIKSVPPEKWDVFHELILTDELSRAGSGGLVWNVIGGLGIGGPPVMHFAQQALKDRILPGIVQGDKRICLAITEPGKMSRKCNTRNSMY